jgi:hypothetical protein
MTMMTLLMPMILISTTPMTMPTTRMSKITHKPPLTRLPTHDAEWGDDGVGRQDRAVLDQAAVLHHTAARLGTQGERGSELGPRMRLYCSPLRKSTVSVLQDRVVLDQAAVLHHTPARLGMQGVGKRGGRQL